MIRELHRWAAGCGIAVRGDDLVVVAVRLRAGGPVVLGRTRIPRFRQRPPLEWGSEHAAFLRSLGLQHLAATLCIPRDETVFRTLSLPSMSRRDVRSAISWQLDDLHPYGDKPILHAWAPLDQQREPSGQRSVAALVAPAETIENYSRLFAAAGIRLASCTTSPSALRAAIRVESGSPGKPFVIADTEGSHLELYGESQAAPAWCTALDLRGVSLCEALRLALEILAPPGYEAPRLALAGETAPLGSPPGLVPRPVGEILAIPVRSPDEFDLARDAVVYGTAIAAARPGLGLGLNLLPPELRRSNAARAYAPTLALVAALVVVAGASHVTRGIQDRRYADTLAQETARLEAAAGSTAPSASTELVLRERMEWLLDRQERTKSDLAALREISQLLPVSAWLSALRLDDNSARLTGNAQNTGPLLAILDRAFSIEEPRFERAPSRGEGGESFQIEARRR